MEIVGFVFRNAAQGDDNSSGGFYLHRFRTRIEEHKLVTTYLAVILEDRPQALNHIFRGEMGFIPFVQDMKETILLKPKPTSLSPKALIYKAIAWPSLGVSFSCVQPKPSLLCFLPWPITSSHLPCSTDCD